MALETDAEPPIAELDRIWEFCGSSAPLAIFGLVSCVVALAECMGSRPLLLQTLDLEAEDLVRQFSIPASHGECARFDWFQKPFLLKSESRDVQAIGEQMADEVNGMSFEAFGARTVGIELRCAGLPEVELRELELKKCIERQFRDACLVEEAATEEAIDDLRRQARTICEEQKAIEGGIQEELKARRRT